MSPIIWRRMTGTEEQRADLFGMARPPDELELGAGSGNEVDWTPEEEKLKRICLGKCCAASEFRKDVGWIVEGKSIGEDSN